MKSKLLGWALAGGMLVWMPWSANCLPQQVYVWQRAWTESVRKALTDHGSAFERIVVLSAEITWREGKPHLIKVPVHYQSLLQTKRPIGFALRIGPYSGSFAREAPAAGYLAEVTEQILAEARAQGVIPAEFQIDFDCSSSKLAGYRAWVETIRERIAPLPLLITALPAWLGKPAFQSLANAADGYVLQLHSLERPKSYDAAFVLCDPVAARRSVLKAMEIGIPFRVALPTYGYLVAFDRHGTFVGLSAEGPARSWPSTARLKEVRADALELAALLRDWSQHPPPSLQGVLWYRLPVAGDILNWRWPTLAAILQMRIPRKSVRVEAHRVEPRLIELSLVNDGELDISSRLAVDTRWSDARWIAGDGLNGFKLAAREFSQAHFETEIRARLPAGETQVIGWLRLSEEREVHCDLQELDGQ